MSDTKHVVLIHGTWARGDSWGPQIAPKTAARYQKVTFVEIPRSDHLVFFGDALPVTMGHIDDWIAQNDVLSTA